MFKFDPENEFELLRLLDELREALSLRSRGHVVEMAIRLLRASIANGTVPREDSMVAFRGPEKETEVL
jgi:hypothetical protein